MSAPSPSEFLSAAPTSVSGSTPWSSRYAVELRRVFLEHAARAPRTLQSHLGPSELGVECLAGETEVVTRAGIRRIRELYEDGSAKLLVPMLYNGSDVRKKWGRFVEAPVEYLGERHVYEITLRRNQERKVIRATAGHRWFRTYYGGKQKKQEVRLTTELLPGHRLTQLRRAMPRSTTLMHWAVAQGFVFGDGTKGSDAGDRHRPATLSLYHNGKDEALLPYFPGDWKVYKQADHAHSYSKITGLPRSWKHLPPIDESTSFLMSWLAGYFAADGCVTEDGHASISSAKREHLEFVRSLAAVCGVGYGQVQTHMRRGISGTEQAAEETPLYKLSLRRRDLPPWFFLSKRHAERAAAANEAGERDPHWIVESVEPTGDAEPVYCARVEGIGAFGLADDLMTGNCDRQVAGKMAALPATNHVADPWPSIVGTACHAWAAEAFTDDNARRGLLRWVAEQKVTPHPEYPGTADLYDASEQCVVDHKFLGESSMAKIRKSWPRHYLVQLLLYGLGYHLMGLPVRRVVLAAYPRTAASLDGLYVRDTGFTGAGPDGSLQILPEVIELLGQVFADTERRKGQSAEILAGRLTLMDVPASPDADTCYFCPFYRPQSAKDGGPGCPGTAGGGVS